MTPKSILPALTLAVASMLSLTATARQEQDAVTPSPVDAGRHAAFLERAKDKQIQIAFLGDSITEGWQSPGKAVWDRYYAKHNAANFGVSGERTEQTLGHIAGGILDGLNPKVVVIMIGTNNIGHSAEEKAEWAAAGVKKIITTVHEKLPNAKILLLAVFPRDAKDSDRRKAVNGINAIISKFDDGKATHYLDISAKFLDASGEIPKDIMPDGLHLSEKGYQIWAEAMQPTLEKLMK